MTQFETKQLRRSSTSEAGDTDSDYAQVMTSRPKQMPPQIRQVFYKSLTKFSGSPAMPFLLLFIS